MTELLFNTTMLSDMGCTYRLFHRKALELVRPHLNIGGSHFGPQLLMEVVAHRIPFVEIPVNYRARVGDSSVTGDLWKAFRLGIRMIVLVFEYRLGFHRRSRTLWDHRDDVRAQPVVAGHSSADLQALAAAIPDVGRTPGPRPTPSSALSSGLQPARRSP